MIVGHDLDVTEVNAARVALHRYDRGVTADRPRRGASHALDAVAAAGARLEHDRGADRVIAIEIIYRAGSANCCRFSRHGHHSVLVVATDLF